MTFTYVDSDYSETGNTVCVGRSKCPIQPLSSRFENCVYVLISQLWHFGIAFNSAVLTNPMARQGMEGMELDILTRSCLAKNGQLRCGVEHAFPAKSKEARSSQSCSRLRMEDGMEMAIEPTLEAGSRVR
jgi:hypothetical protein